MRTKVLELTVIVAALLACKTQEAKRDLPEAPPLPSGTSATGTDAAPGASPTAPTDQPAAEPTDGKAPGAPPGTHPAPADAGSKQDSGARDGGTGDAGSGDAGSKDAGTTQTYDASVGDLQKRAEACLKNCSKQFEKCKSVDISKLGECLQVQSSCTASCK